MKNVPLHQHFSAVSMSVLVRNNLNKNAIGVRICDKPDLSPELAAGSL